MESFEELGLSPELVEALSAEGVEVPTALQRSAIPVLLRGNHLLALAGPGAGTLVTYGVPLLESADPEATSPQALVLNPSVDRSLGLARSLSRLAQATGHRIAALGPPWALPELASILFAPPVELLRAVRASALSLDGVRTVVVDGFASLQPEDRAALDTLFEIVPKEGQRILLTLPFTSDAEAFGQAHCPKAVHLPPRSATPRGEASPPRGEVAYRVTGEDKETELLDSVARILRSASRHVLLFFRSDDQAADVSDLLALHGYLSGAPGDSSFPVWLSSEELEARRAVEALDDSHGPVVVLSFDVPPDPDSLDRRHGGKNPGVVLVRPREIPHLKEMAARTGYRLVPDQVSPPPSLAGELDRLRDRVRRALEEEDLAPLYLALEPLFHSHSPGEVAAACMALFRKKISDGGRSGRPEPSGGGEARKGPLPGKAWVRLFVGVGERDGVGPGDLLGAIAGEADLEGSRVGKIEIRDTFSLVEVAPSEADRIIHALNGTTIRGRSARVDYDRGGGRGRGRPGGPGSGKRKLRKGPPPER
jgi:ATP-dependent RNA helicase DeaD